MRDTRLVICFLIAVWIHPDVATAQTRVMTIHDALKMVRVGDALLSPDGDRVFYSLAHLRWDKNSYEKRFYMADSQGDRRVRYIGEAGGSDFQFSPGGAYLSFLRKAGDEGHKQVWAMSTRGGEAFALTSHRGEIVGYDWFDDDSGIVFLAKETGSEEEEKERKLGDDAVFIDEAPHGKEAARFTNFWRLSVQDRKESRLTRLSLVVSDFDVSPEGGRIAFVARPDTRTNYPGQAELYLHEIASGALRRLTRNAAPESDPLWSPDGTRIAYRAPSDKDFDLRNGYFWILELASDRRRRLDGQVTGEISGRTAWTPRGRFLLYNELRGTDTNLYRMDVETGTATALTRSTGTLVARAFSRDRTRMLYTYENFLAAPDLFVSDLSGLDPVRVTDANPSFASRLQLSRPELLRWTGKGGMEIEGVFYPALNQSASRVPMILNIHGGPAGVVENRFRPDLQILAGQGYAVLAPNFRGSTGYGDETLRGLMGEVGDGELIDLLQGVDYAVRHRRVDPDRLGVRGWSWGGVSASYTITQTDRFKAASVGAMVGNWAAETGPGFNFDVSLWYIGGTPWDNAQEWRLRSSMTHVRNVTTPTILFHGGIDRVSSVGQSLMFFTALRDIGKAPVRYIKFPRTAHNLREPRHLRTRSIQEMQWFKKYIDGQEWSAPPVHELLDGVRPE